MWDFDVEKFQEIVLERGRVVCLASCDCGYPGGGGSAGVIRFAGLYWAYDDNGGFGGPHESLWDALGEEHLHFGNVQVSVSVEGMSAARYAAAMTVEAPVGHAIDLNGERWVLDEDGYLSPAEPPKKKARRKKGKGRKD